MLRIIRKKRCKIVYRSEYFSGLHGTQSRNTFDVVKYKKVRDQLIKEKLIRRADILTPPRLSDKDLMLVHTRDYLDKLRDPMTVGKILNLDYVNPWDEYIFEYFRYVSGGTLLGAEYALKNNTTVFNLGGGYHHAHPDRGEGFCLINDVAIAIRKLRKAGRLRKTLIADLDYHQGNGNLLYFKNDESTFTFSLHAVDWDVISGKRHNISVELPSHTNDETYLKILRNEFSRVFTIFQPELIFYIAGSDPYIMDTLGDFDISEEGMLKRDMYIYRETRNRNIPFVVLGAGGYGPESWKIYYNFIKRVIVKGK